jgi:hypothetical protein
MMTRIYWLIVSAIVLAMVSGAVLAVDVHPRKEMTCGGDGSTIKQARIALLSKGAQRTYRTITDRMSGQVALKFTQRTTALTVDAVRLSCVLVNENGFQDKTTRDLELVSPVTIPVGEIPETTVVVGASPRKITWPAASSAPPAPPPPPPATTPPIAPNSPSLTPDPGGVKASWNAVPGAEQYRVSWGHESPNTPTRVDVVVKKDLTTGVLPTSVVVPMQHKGWLCVATQIGTAESSGSCNGYVPAGSSLPPPTLTAQLTWDAVSVATGYRVHIGTVPGFEIGAGIDVGNVTTYAATGFVAGTTRYFKVTAYDAQGAESVPSNEVPKVF